MIVRNLSKSAALLLGFSLLTACAEREVILQGTREAIRTSEAAVAQAGANKVQRISLPRQVTPGKWPHAGYNATNNLPHVRLNGALQPVWATTIGKGNDLRHRITAEPVSDGKRIFAMDSRATVTAVQPNGAPVWSRDLTPFGDKPDDASGGGLAVVGGKLYAATGFGELIVMEAASGKEVWRQQLNAPITGAPVIAGGQVYLTTRDGRGWALSEKTGRLRWQALAAEDNSGVTGGAGPAVGSKFAIFPFGSGQLTAAYRREGFEAWKGSVTGGRLGVTRARVTDITSDPVISGSRIYVGNPGGRTVALDAQTGRRVWTAGTGAMGTVVVAGGSVFAVSDVAGLVRLDARSGAQIWKAALPNLVPVRNKRRARDVYVHYGPLLAGGTLWVASSDGQLRGFDPASGQVTRSVSLGAPAAGRPISVGGLLYVMTADGKLRAFR